MNTTALVTHGLSAVSVHSERVGVRLLLVSQVFIAIVFGMMLTVVGVKFCTTLAIPGWATSAFGLTLILLTQLIITSFFFVFFVLGNRNQQNFVPARDFQYYLARVEVWKEPLS